MNLFSLSLVTVRFYAKSSRYNGTSAMLYVCLCVCMLVTINMKLSNKAKTVLVCSSILKLKLHGKIYTRPTHVLIANAHERR